jgi:hypothetical protein
MAERTYTAAMVGFAFGMSERITITNPMHLLGLGFKSGVTLESKTPPNSVMQALRLPSTFLPTF